MTRKQGEKQRIKTTLRTLHNTNAMETFFSFLYFFFIQKIKKKSRVEYEVDQERKIFCEIKTPPNVNAFFLFFFRLPARKRAGA